MPESEQEPTPPAPRINEELAKRVVAEVDLCYTLGIERQSLDVLRKRGLPAVYLNRNNRVYLLDEVINWLSANRGSYYAKDKI